MDDATSTLIVLKELYGNPQPHLNALQTFLHNHIDTMVTLWSCVWITTVLFLVWYVRNEYRKHRHDQ